jgi:hypothetical protein
MYFFFNPQVRLLIMDSLSFFNNIGAFIFSTVEIWLIFFFAFGTYALIDFTILAFHYSIGRSNITLL